MSFIEQTEKNLYKKGAEAEGRPSGPGALNPENIDIKKTSYSSWQTPPKFGLSQKTKKIIYVALGVVVFAIISFYGISKYLEYTSWSVDKIDMALEGPKSLTSGAQAKWTVSILNKNKSALEDVELTFDFPEGSYVPSSGFIKEQKGTQAKVNLYNIAAGQSIQKEFTARIVAPENSARSASATINFKPKGISREVKKSVKFTTSIVNFPIIIKIDAPRQIFSNAELLYRINYINSSQEAFTNLRIKVQYPPGFTPNEFEPQPAQEKNIWQIDKLSKTQEGQIKIKGVLNGEENEFKTILVMIEGMEGDGYVAFTKQTAQTEIVKSPLTLKIEVNNKENPSVNVGQWIRYDIKFQNNFDAPLQDLYLSAKLEGVMFNLRTLKTNGYFDVNTNTITWGPREIPSLKTLDPNESGWTSFEISLRNIFPILNASDKEFFVKTYFNIGTKIVPPLIGIKEINHSTAVITKINTQLILRAKAFYRENFSSIQNYGPMPPRVGQTTTFTLHWQIINVSNDVDNLVVSSTLPTGVMWTNNYYANFKRDGIVFDETTKRITWNIGKVPATTGIANGLPVYQAVFQVAISPGPHQIGRSVYLLDKSTAIAQDGFTGANLEVTEQTLSTATIEDSSIKGSERIVQP